MPVEIREVIIRAEVSQKQQPESFAPAPSHLSPEMRQMIRSICADEIRQASSQWSNNSNVDRFER